MCVWGGNENKCYTISFSVLRSKTVIKTGSKRGKDRGCQRGGMRYTVPPSVRKPDGHNSKKTDGYILSIKRKSIYAPITERQLVAERSTTSRASEEARKGEKGTEGKK